MSANLLFSILQDETGSLSKALDAFGSTQGTVIYRGASTWQALGAGVAGQVLTSGGPSGNLSWGAAANVTGPGSSIAGHIASFADATGKVLADAVAVGLGGTSSVPSLDFYRATTSTGQINGITFTTQNASGTVLQFGDISCYNDFGGAGFEFAHWQISTRYNGAYATRFSVGGGFFSRNASGGDQGLDSINVLSYFRNGVALPITKGFVSTQQTITSAGSLTLAHGLGVAPPIYAGFIQCVTAENGYAVGAELPVYSSAGTANSSVALVPDATNINVRFSSPASSFSGINFTTGATCTFTNANWRFVVRAWAP